MIGIIPVAGKASRWTGYFKEFLPIGNGKVLLDNAVDVCRKQGCSSIILVTSADKIQLHANHFKEHNDICYKIQSDFSKDLLGAITTGFCSTESKGGFLFVMPDTLFSIRNKLIDTSKAITFGIFKTINPHKFGVLLHDKIIDKETSLTNGVTIYDAWGTIYFSSEAATFICKEGFDNQVHAYNATMKKFGYGTFDLDYYKDFASYDSYKEWLLDERTDSY